MTALVGMRHRLGSNLIQLNSLILVVTPGLPFKLKPIFHCDAKPLALGPGVGLDPQRHTFASPNTKYTNMLVYFGVTLH